MKGILEQVGEINSVEEQDEQIQVVNIPGAYIVIFFFVPFRSLFRATEYIYL